MKKGDTKEWQLPTRQDGRYEWHAMGVNPARLERSPTPSFARQIGGQSALRSTTSWLRFAPLHAAGRATAMAHYPYGRIFPARYLWL